MLTFVPVRFAKPPIGSRTTDVIVPYGEGKEIIAELGSKRAEEDIKYLKKLIKKARDLGDKGAVLDGIELFVLSKNEDVWNMFKADASTAELLPQVRAGMILYAVRADNKEIFYTAAIGKNSDILYKDAQVLKLLEDGVKKFASDKRAKEVQSKIDAQKK